MKFGDFLNGGFVIEGWKRVQTWVDDKPVLLAEGYRLDNVSKYLDWGVAYIFPYTKENDEAAICIELVEGE
jgi:hypothetical protein